MTADHKKKIALALVLFLIVFFLHRLGITNYINFAFFSEHKEQIIAFIEKHYLLSVLFYIALNWVVVATALPISAFLNIIGGFLFNIVPGVIYTNIGVTLGALTSFLVVRYLLADGFKAKYAKAAQAFETEFKQRGGNYLLAMQLFPLTPFALINILTALSGMSIFTFYWATALGILPGQIIYAYAGKQLGTVGSVKDVMSPSLTLTLVLLTFLSLLPIILKRMRLVK